MQVLLNSKVKFVSFSQLLGLVFLSLFRSDSTPFTAPGLIFSVGEKKKRKKSLLLALKQSRSSADLLGCSRLRQVGFHSSPFLWFCEDGGQVWATLFTVAQPLAQFLCLLPGPYYPSMPGSCLQSTSGAVLVVH